MTTAAVVGGGAAGRASDGSVWHVLLRDPTVPLMQLLLLLLICCLLTSHPVSMCQTALSCRLYRLTDLGNYNRKVLVECRKWSLPPTYLPWAAPGPAFTAVSHPDGLSFPPAGLLGFTVKSRRHWQNRNTDKKPCNIHADHIQVGVWSRLSSEGSFYQMKISVNQRRTTLTTLSLDFHISFCPSWHGLSSCV